MNNLKILLRDKCPDFFWLRTFLKRIRLNGYYKFVIPEEDIIKAEKNLEFKKTITYEYANRWSAYRKDVDDKIEMLLSAAPMYQDRGDLDKVSVDMQFCRFAYGFQPDEYLCYGLESKSYEERKEYISDIERYRYVSTLNDPVDFVLLFDKAKTYELFKKFYGRKVISLEQEKDFKEFVDFAQNNHVFVKKRVELSRGDSVELIDLEDRYARLAYCKNMDCVKDKKFMQSVFSELISKGKIVLEELIIQDESMGKVNASSVNTIRCITFNTEHGIQIGYCFAKFGRDGSFVDNGARGGLLVGVDRVTGYLVTDGYDEYGIKYCKHPDSSVTFKNYKLEKWDQLISICLEASSLIPSVRYIGWDLALTPDGWIIVEGNGGGQMIGPQTVFERGLKREINQMIGRKYVPDNFRKGKSK